MPVYNCGHYLDEAIRSIRDQTFTDFEFVIVNDGSTDDSLEVIERHAAEDSRIVVLDRPNGGIVDALNAGLAVCQGEYIARMDGDDISLPERLSVQLKFFEKNPQCVLVGSQVYTLNDKNGICGEMTHPLTSNDIIIHGLKQGGGPIIHPTFLMRVWAVKKIDGYRERMCLAEDLDLIFRLAEVGSVANVPEYLLMYRIHPEQTSHRYNYKQTLAVIAAVEDAARRRNADVSQLSSNLLVQASWQATDTGHRIQGLFFALKSILLAPLSLLTYRAFFRSIMFGFFRVHRERGTK